MHESSKFCNVNITRGNTDYKCPSCDSVEVQNTHISGGVEFQLKKITKELKETTEVQTKINCLRDILNMSHLLDYEILYKVDTVEEIKKLRSKPGDLGVRARLLFTILTNEVAMEIEEGEIVEGDEYIEHNMNDLVNIENPCSNDNSRGESTRKSKEKYSE